MAPKPFVWSIGDEIFKNKKKKYTGHEIRACFI
jgi:hypothetical protein